MTVGAAANSNGREPSTADLHGKAAPPRLAYSIGEACEALGVSQAFWRENVAGEVRIVRRGRRRLVAVAELEAWLDANGERTLERRRAS